MSAKNWTECPRCRRLAGQRQTQALKTAEDSYGKVSREAYRELVKQAEAEPVLRDTLREEWELGMSTNGNFFVRYRCACEECGFTHEFETVDASSYAKIMAND